MLLEVVERLCNVTAALIEIVDAQAVIIEQSKIADYVKEELQNMRDEANKEFQSITAKYNDRK